MSKRRRTCPPSDSMAGMFGTDERLREERSAPALLGVVGLVLGDLFGRLSFLALFDRRVLDLDVLDRLGGFRSLGGLFDGVLDRGVFNRGVLDLRLFDRRGLGRCG